MSRNVTNTPDPGDEVTGLDLPEMAKVVLGRWKVKATSERVNEFVAEMRHVFVAGRVVGREDSERALRKRPQVEEFERVLEEAIKAKDEANASEDGLLF